MTRGYFGIGVYLPKAPENLGLLWRSAHAFGASWVFTIGKRWPKAGDRKIARTDTTDAARHLPWIQHETFDDFWRVIPSGAALIAVETDGSAALPAFQHPIRAVYLLGAEDRGLPRDVLDRCRSSVTIPSAYCLNVATAASVAMYDRAAKVARAKAVAA